MPSPALGRRPSDTGSLRNTPLSSELRIFFEGLMYKGQVNFHYLLVAPLSFLTWYPACVGPSLGSRISWRYGEKQGCRVG